LVLTFAVKKSYKPRSGSLVAEIQGANYARNQKDSQMKLIRGQRSAARLRIRAFSLVDGLFAMALAGVMFTALYAGLAYGFKIIQMARENTRATQIMLEHMEIIRLYKWDQVTNLGGFLPTNSFTVPYYSVGGTNQSLLYTAKVSVLPAPVSGAMGFASYAPNMRKVTIRLDWGQLGNTNRTRMMSTYVARNGLQSYVW
jgi:hypothetical protein